MNRYLLKKIARMLSLLLPVAFLIAMTSGSADAYSLMAASPGGRLTMNLAMQGPIGNQSISDAITQWNQVGVGSGPDHAFFTAKESGASGSCGRNQSNEVTWSDTNCGLAFDNGTLAVTTTWWSSGKAIEVDILFNSTKHWSSYSGPLRYSTDGTLINDLNRVALHELGHAAGLGHPDQDGQFVSSIMNSHISHIDALQADDIAGAHALAWHASTTGSTPICELTASPNIISAGGFSTLAATCTPAATSYFWTDSGFDSAASEGSVSPSQTTTYTVKGFNAVGAGNVASVTISVAAPVSTHAVAEVPVCTLTASPSAILAGEWTTLQATCSPLATSYSWTNTSFASVASGGVASPSKTTNYAVTGINANGAGNAASVVVAVTSGATNYADLWWGGSDENGWGMSIHQHGNRMFNVLYVYGDLGQPVWYVMPTGTWDSEFGTYSGLLYQPESAPLSAYSPMRFAPGAAIGNLTINFTGTSTAIIRYSINGVSGQRAIQRQIFGHGVAPLNVSDMWWGGTSQDGWGISLNQQSGIVFGAWFTYGPDGRVTWYVMPNGAWDGTIYSGPFYSTISSPWLGGAYKANQLAVQEAGLMSLSFSGGGNAIMTYAFTSGPFAGTTQSRQIVRQPF